MKSPLKLPRDQVEALRPGDVRLFSTSRGWVPKRNGVTDKAMEFRHPSFPGAELLLPLKREVGDFVLRMATSSWVSPRSNNAPRGRSLRTCLVRQATFSGFVSSPLTLNWAACLWLRVSTFFEAVVTCFWRRLAARFARSHSIP